MTPTQYINKLDEPQKSGVKKLHKLILKVAKKMKPFMYDKNIIGYGKFQYKTRSGCAGDWFHIGLSSRKNYISLYVSCAKDGKYLAESYKKKLPKASIGKSCIRFKKLEDLDQKTLKTLLKEAVKLSNQGYSISV